MNTANGTIRADAGTLDRLEIGGIEARKLKIVISPGLGDTDVLGMNFLSQLQSWRVENRTLILTPERAKPAGLRNAPCGSTIERRQPPTGRASGRGKAC